MRFNFALILFFCLNLLGAQHEYFSQEKNIFTFGKVFVDTNGSYNLDKLLKDDKFLSFSEEVMRQSFTPYYYWVKLDLSENKSDSYSIISKNIFIDSISLFTKTNNKWNEEDAGLLIPGSSNGNSVISLTIPENIESSTCYLKVHSKCISALDIWLIKDQDLNKQENFKFVFYAIITILIAFYLFAVIFLYLVSKNKELFVLVFYALSSILMILFTNGYLYAWFPFLGFTFNKWSFVYVVDIYWGAAAMLSYNLFKIRTDFIRLKKVFYGAFGFLILMMFSPLYMGRIQITQIHFIIPTLFILFNTIMGTIVFIKTKKKESLFLTLGWLIYFCLLIIWSVSKMGYGPKSFFTDNAPVFGLIIEFLLFAIIGGRYYIASYNESIILKDKLNKINTQKEEIETQYGEMFDSLSEREIEVLKLLSEGLLDKEIADKLDLSLPSVRTYSKRIYTKLNVANRTEASVIYNKITFAKSL